MDLEEMQHNQHQARSSLELSNIQRFKNLTSLKMQGFGTLKYLLSSSTTSSMGQLKYLVIEDCKVMEEVIQTCTEDLGEGEIISRVFFPRLEGLLLKNLPILRRFCIGSRIKFPSLKHLWIEKCPKLNSFIFNSVSSGMNSEESSHTAMQPLFNEEVNLF